MLKKNDNPLPSPSDLPNADVVIFDGQCVFCTGQVRNLQRLDSGNRLAFISLHDPFVKQSYPDLTHEQLMDQIYLIPNRQPDKRYAGAAVLRYLTRRLPKLWIFAPFLHIPFTLPIWQWGYMQVAKRRYRIANKDGQACDENGTCDLHFKD